jgi:hypothetical protein
MPRTWTGCALSDQCVIFIRSKFHQWQIGMATFAVGTVASFVSYGEAMKP